MSEISQELVERMVAFIRDAATWPVVGCDEAREIAKLLPEPVDPDLIEVRRLADECGVNISDKAAQAIVSYFKGRTK